MATMLSNTGLSTCLCGRTPSQGTCFKPVQPKRCLQRVAPTRNIKRSKSVAPRAAMRSPVVQAVDAGNTFVKTFDRNEAQADLRFVELLDGTNKILIVSEVAPGSTAEKEGVKVGQQLLGVSDPVNENQLLSLETKPSKMALNRAMKLRRYPDLEMKFSASVPQVAKDIMKGASGDEVAKALEASEVVQKDTQESTSPQRNAQKREYMAAQFETREGNTGKAQAVKGKNQFAIVAALGFFVIPLAFIAVAVFSGYLSSLGGPGSQL